MLVKHLRTLVDAVQGLRGDLARRAVTPIALGGDMPGGDELPKAPHDYQTFHVVAPARCRVVGFVIDSRAGGQLEVRHVLFGKERVAQFHGEALPAGMFSDQRAREELAWGVLEKDDPVEVNLAWNHPQAHALRIPRVRMSLLTLALEEDAEAFTPPTEKRSIAAQLEKINRRRPTK